MDLDDTDRIRMSSSDRVAVENRVDRLETRLVQHQSDRGDEIDRFYSGRMVPLEKQASTSRVAAIVAIGIAACAFVLALTVLGVVLWLHAQ